MVTVNYRLGPRGFAHPALTKAAKPDEGLASYGLMDAMAALEWVQRNIAKFGGDPTNVTLFGQSAGGGMVLSLLSVPSGKGLFAKAGIESGAGLRPATPARRPRKQGVDWATIGLTAPMRRSSNCAQFLWRSLPNRERASRCSWQSHRRSLQDAGDA